ncbi:unnamed protein product [Ectocarpus sp. 13 AM-2016]
MFCGQEQRKSRMAHVGSFMGGERQRHNVRAINRTEGHCEYASISGGGSPDDCDEHGHAVNPIVDETHNYGWTDYRSISWWKFPARPLLKPSARAKMTIGTLHVKVVEARGLMSRDFAGKSDPFAELELTGRYDGLPLCSFPAQGYAQLLVMPLIEGLLIAWSCKSVMYGTKVHECVVSSKL